MEVRSVEAIVRALDTANVQYLIVGGLAVVAHGYERLTRDVDLVIGLEPENITRGLHALQSIDYHMAIPVTAEEFANPTTREDWRREKNMIALRLWSGAHRRTPIDVFVYEPFDFNVEFASVQRLSIANGLTAPVVSYATLLAMKQSAGRGKDLLDIQALSKLDSYR